MSTAQKLKQKTKTDVIAYVGPPRDGEAMAEGSLGLHGQQPSLLGKF